MTARPVLLLTYSTKPRGGVVHTLALAEALHAAGVSVRVLALGEPATGFFRPVAAPVTIVPGPSGDLALEDKVAASIDRLAAALAETDAPLLHAQDCIAARAAARVRDGGAAVTVLRTVHHVDDFSSQVLMDCQRAAILEPDVVLTVSRGVAADPRAGLRRPRRRGAQRCRHRPLRRGGPGRAAQLRATVGATDGRSSLPSGASSPARAATHSCAHWPRSKPTGRWHRCSRSSAATRSRTTGLTESGCSACFQSWV